MLFRNFPTDKFDILYVDPPWFTNVKQFTYGTDGKSMREVMSIGDHYNMVKLDDLKTLPVADIANDNSLLFLWCCAFNVDQAIDLMRAWNFKYVTVVFVWDKVRVNVGHYVVPQTEFVLLGKKGKIPKPRGSRKERQLVVERKTVHSKKPNEVRYRIQRMFPSQKKIELFARWEGDDDWTTWGNETHLNI